MGGEGVGGGGGGAVSCLRRRDASGIKQLSRAQKEPSKFTKKHTHTHSKQALCCADVKDDWLVICFPNGQIARCHSPPPPHVTE